MSQGQRVDRLEKAVSQDDDELVTVDWSEAGAEREPVPAGVTVIELTVEDRLVVRRGQSGR